MTLKGPFVENINCHHIANDKQFTVIEILVNFYYLFTNTLNTIFATGWDRILSYRRMLLQAFKQDG